jgi:hypothetical protein
MRSIPQHVGRLLTLSEVCNFWLLYSALALLLPTVVRASHYPSPVDWRNENIYQILTDRMWWSRRPTWFLLCGLRNRFPRR